MAADSSSPWSRWDAPGFQFVSTNTQPTIQRQFDFNGQQQNNFGQNNFQQNQNGFQRDSGLIFGGGRLVEQRVNSLDPAFYDCVYGVANSAQTQIEQCYKDIGCCETTCCYNGAWQDKYAWAVALIVIFCFLVVVAILITLVCWLFNRSADKNQKRDLLTNAGLSPAQSQLSLASPVGPAYGSGYPSPGGYRY